MQVLNNFIINKNTELFVNIFINNPAGCFMILSSTKQVQTHSFVYKIFSPYKSLCVSLFSLYMYVYADTHAHMCNTQKDHLLKQMTRCRWQYKILFQFYAYNLNSPGAVGIQKRRTGTECNERKYKIGNMGTYQFAFSFFLLNI